MIENKPIKTKFALISDIHGNFPALCAVIEDAKTQGAEQLILLGDYIEDLPWPNEVADTVKCLENAVIIGGNKEGYLLNMQKADQTKWIYEQMVPLYWNYRELTPDNLNYFISLPVSAEIKSQNGENIFLSHSSSIFYRRPKIESFHSSKYLAKMLNAPFTHEEYLEFCNKSLSENQDAMSEISVLPKGVYAFGHNHLQWHTQIGDKIFVNPGSCGMPLDFDTRAPYTMLEQTPNGWVITERRVPYDTESVIRSLLSSELYNQAEIWSRIMIKQLRTGGDYISRFLAHVETLAKERNFPTRPACNEIWREAAASFRLMNIYEN